MPDHDYDSHIRRSHKRARGIEHAPGLGDAIHVLSKATVPSKKGMFRLNELYYSCIIEFNIFN